MKTKFGYIAILMLFVAVSFNACDNSKENQYTSDYGFTAGDITFINGDGAGCIMVYVPGKSFKKNFIDSETGTVERAFWIGETEVTYDLWYTVYHWATTEATSPYIFANAGREGNDGGIGAAPTDIEPVTYITWLDAVVWCNALTEWCNTKNSTNYTCVYNDGGNPIRNSSGAAAIGVCTPDNTEILSDDTATGFRLPTSDEWELAARYIDDSNNDGDISDFGEYYPGNYASGAMADYNNTAATDFVAVSFYNSSSSTASVKSKSTASANTLGIYDMSGNVWEWCYDWFPSYEGSYRVIRGGGWNGTRDFLCVGGSSYNCDPYIDNTQIGIRFVRSAD